MKQYLKYYGFLFGCFLTIMFIFTVIFGFLYNLAILVLGNWIWSLPMYFGSIAVAILAFMLWLGEEK